MTGFSLRRVPAIAIGAGRTAGLGDDVAGLCAGPASVLLVADPGLVPFGITDRAAASLSATGHRVRRFENIVSDPREAQVAEGVALARAVGAGAVVGLGGGSALDAAKMIAVLAGADAELTAFRLAAVPLPARRLPLVCVPTTAGTGSETTGVSVLSDDDHAKYWYWGEPLKADCVILDPELTTGLPHGLTVATGLDALVHAIEAATNRHHNEANDLHAMAAVRLSVRHLPAAAARPDDLEARGGMLLAAAYAGIAIDNAGTAIAHNIGHALGSLMPIHHGRAVAIAMEATLPWVIEGDREAFARVAETFGIGPDPDALPAAYAALLDRLGFDRSLPRPVEAAALAARMGLPENGTMRRSTARRVTDEDLEPLAARVVALAGASPAAS